MQKERDSRRRPCRLCGTETLAPVYYLDEVEIGRCPACGFIQIAAAFCLGDLKAHYHDPGEDRSHLWPAFDQQKIFRASRFRVHYFQKYTGLRQGYVLEIGSAQGHFLALLQTRGFQVLGVEPGAEGARRHREKGLPVINDLLEQAHLPQAHFDAVCLFQVFEHFEDPRQVARTLHALLKPSGFVVLEVPDIYSLGARFEKQPQNLFKKEHISYFSPASLEGLMIGAGFTPVHAHHYDYDMFRLPFARSLKKIWLPLLKPDFPGLLDKILNREVPLQYRQAPAGRIEPPHLKPKTSWKAFGKSLRKSLTAPLDLACGYLAYRLDRGASLFWIGRKEPGGEQV
jgi:2-polyprenyl-3-methyl-5-hydroxy-6-metoxy-1,4-benzoquinol methylase